MPIESFYALIAALVILLGLHIRTELRLRKLLRGKHAHTLEDSITHLVDAIANLQAFEKKSNTIHRDLDNRLKRSVQSIDVVRFNPFKGTGTGGNQSFAISFLDERGEGLVLSSLHHREGMSIFSKPVTSFASPFELTEEETLSIDNAKNKLCQLTQPQKTKTS